MTKKLQYGEFGVYVYRERGGKHHRPHAHIKFKGKKVASIYLLTLTPFHQVERVPLGLLDEIEAHQDELLRAWEDMNRA